MKKYIFFILLVASLSLATADILYAQEDNAEAQSPFSISCDFMSRYVWRGTDFGGAPSIQPGIEYSKNGFSIGAWGAYATNGPGLQEADLYISYAFSDMFSLTFTDYYFPDELADYKYYDFKKATTGHVFEASLSFNGTEKFPLSILIATNIGGADAKKINSDGSTGGIQYSTYAEFTYSFTHFDLFLGANLTSVDVENGESGFYGNDFGVVNLGITATKEINITNTFKLPLTVSLITNPLAEKIYLVAGFSF